ncbi:hepatoma-derived growth factor-related protein 2-like isoform X2 [Hippocampus zosterae]|uniref:hepatoma-derived growth factor-related protein 2-like isoform X2 n=1 Tax=Hippocampus zosterae TaxID=109293 RepID=UPI00223E106F|nr:hepatoma-derived growth factor-related protein 2-like isoform X2 [Hippocampus zosterae]
MPPKRQFKAGDLVFAKMKGFPHWPARICKFDETQKSRVGVFFFGTHQIGYLTPARIVPFSGNKLKYGSGVRLKGFSEGMWEIQNTPGIGKKSTFAGKSTPGKPSGTLKATSSLLKKRTKSQGVRRLGADADVAAVNASPEAAACDSGTLCLKECVVKCVPAKTPRGPGSDANDSPAARAASDAEATSAPVTKTLRRSSSRSSAQMEDNKMETPTPREGDASHVDGVPPRQRRGRPSKASMQKKSDVAQAEEGPAAAMSGAHPTATTLRLKPCLVKCGPAHGRAKGRRPADPPRASASAPGALATAAVKRRPGRPSKADAKKRAQKSHQVPSPPTPSAPPESHSAPAAPQTAEAATGGAAAKLGTSGPSRARMSEEKGGGEGAEKATMATAGRGRKRKKVAEGKETTNPEGARKAKVTTEETTPSPGGAGHSGEGFQKDGKGGSWGATKEVKEANLEETEQKGGRPDVTADAPGPQEKVKRQQRKETQQTGGREPEADPTTPSPGGDSGARGGKKEETEREGGEGGKAQVTAGESAPRRGRKRKPAEISQTDGGEERRTEEAAPTGDGTKRRAAQDARGPRGHRAPTEATAEETTLGPEGKIKTRERREDEEGKAAEAESTPGPGEVTAEEGNQRGGGEERPTAGESTEGKRRRKDCEEEEEPDRGKAEATAEESAPGPAETSAANEGQREHGGLTEAATEESAPGRGGHRTATGEERKTEVSPPRRGGGRWRREGAAKEAGRPPKKEAKPAAAAARRPRGTKTTRGGAEEGARTKDGGGERTRTARKEDAAKDKQGSHVDDERQRRLAAKRESVLKSLRGLLKATRGGRRREAAAKSFTKAAIRVKTKRMRGHKMLQEATAGKKSRPPAPAGAKPPPAAAKESHGKLTGGPETRPQEPPNKDGRKLIGKIVKATTKVQVKTMMGGATLPPPQEGEATGGGRAAAAAHGSEEERKPQRVLTDDEKAATKRRHEKDAAKAGGAEPGRKSADGRQEANKNLTPTDSTLHRIHGDIRIWLKSGNPDVAKCLAALDQLSSIYVTSQHVHKHSELISTLRKMRFYRANQDIMDKAAMLYNRFKNAFLLGEGDQVVSAAFLRSLLEEKERQEEELCNNYKRAAGDEEGEVPAHRPPSAD